MSADAPHETDERFPTGEWKGFFVQPDSRQRYVMDLFLQFADGLIRGEGDDAIARFTIRGTYDTRTGGCSWTKEYVGMHRVEYAGQARNRGIVGQWSVPGMPAFWTGPFFIWPKALGDQESAYERAFLEYSLESPQERIPAEAAAANP